MKFKYIYYYAAAAAIFFSGFYIGGERSKKNEEIVQKFSGASADQEKSQKNSANEERIAAAEDNKNVKDAAVAAVRHSGDKEDYLSHRRGDGRHDKETKAPVPIIDKLLSSMQEHGLPKEDAARIAAAMKAAEEAGRQEQLPQKETADTAASTAMNEEEIIANFRKAGVPDEAIGPMALAVSRSLKGRNTIVSKEEVTSNFRKAGILEEDANRMADAMRFKPEKDAEIAANIEKMKSQIAVDLRKAEAADEGDEDGASSSQRTMPSSSK